MKNSAPMGVFVDDFAITSAYWETVMTKNYSQPEKELMLAVLKDALMTYKKRMRLGNALFREAETWFFSTEKDRLFSFETVCAILGLSPGRIRNELLAWRLNILSDLAPGAQQQRHGPKTNTRQLKPALAHSL